MVCPSLWLLRVALGTSVLWLGLASAFGQQGPAAPGTSFLVAAPLVQGREGDEFIVLDSPADEGEMVLGQAIPATTSDDYSPFAGVCCDECTAGYEIQAWEHPYCRWALDLSLLAGIHGFKGPLDQGRNGNFGIHEGLNFGMPLFEVLGYDLGAQLGVNAVHSNFAGDQASGMFRSADRNQFFLTGGVFHRKLEGGFQSGVVFDLLFDNYYAKAALKQIRSDSSFVLPGGKREIGYFGAYGTGGDNFVLLDRRSIFQQPTDVFAVYYRRYFEGGGDGRLWAGMTGRGDGIVGAEMRAPLGKNWAVENRFNYLIPKQGRGEDGAVQESWGLVMQIVWYPGQSARCVRCSPYRPMLNVADNALFMTDTFITATP